MQVKENRYILFLGFPWKLKGVDILIQAFLQIADRHPDVTLRVVGLCPDRRPFERLASGHPRISLEDPVMPDEVASLMTGCEILVLPSRTEGMPKVLLEAMAARRTFIASRVGGIPTYVEDGKNGLLFDPEDVEQLAEKMSLLLSDRDYAARLADEGNRRVFELWSEERYVENFRNMIVRVIGAEVSND
jgi:glycosyltransferase involved in cell wall biosynthesis